MQVLGGVRERPPRRGRAHRRPAALLPRRLPAGADADRGGVPDPRGRGDARRGYLVHAGGAARACRGGCRSRCWPSSAWLSAGLRRLALGKGRELWRGLAVLRSLNGGSRVVGFVLIAVFAQIFRNWLLLHAVGVDASFFDAIAVLIAVVTLGSCPSARPSAPPPRCSSSAATGSQPRPPPGCCSPSPGRSAASALPPGRGPIGSGPQRGRAGGAWQAPPDRPRHGAHRDIPP